MDDNVSHLVSECNELAQNKYKKLRHDKVAAMDSGGRRNMNILLKRKGGH